MYEISSLNVGKTQQKHHKSHINIYKHREIKYYPKIFMENLNHKGLNK